MPIKGITDQIAPAKLDPGKPIRLGYLQKGRREGFGKQIRLYDDDYFHFKPVDTGEKGRQLKALFAQAYGEKPDVIPDVRIPVSIAGNFRIEDCAWLTARKHTKKGSIFLAMSDGENIKRMRNPRTGRVDYIYDGDALHEDVSRTDENGNDCFPYKDALYPWQREMQIDLILPAFNELVYAAELAGYGVVTLLLRGAYDIPNIVQEYQAILNEVATLTSNPMHTGDYERARNYAPLRNIPLRLFRSTDKISTPNWKSRDRGDRLLSVRSLVHWQLGAQFSQAAQAALDRRTQLTLQAVADMPLLDRGDGRSPQQALAELNNELFDAPLDESKRLTAVTAPPASSGPDWDAFTTDLPEDAPEEPETVQGEFADDPEPEEDAYDWESQTAAATHIDDFAYAYYQGVKGKPVCPYDDSAHLKKAIEYLCEGARFDTYKNGLIVEALGRYERTLADGEKKGAAARAAKKWYAQAVQEMETAVAQADAASEEE